LLAEAEEEEDGDTENDTESAQEDNNETGTPRRRRHRSSEGSNSSHLEDIVKQISIKVCMSIYFCVNLYYSLITVFNSFQLKYSPNNRCSFKLNKILFHTIKFLMNILITLPSGLNFPLKFFCSNYNA
jgi:hypothetical protein